MYRKCYTKSVRKFEEEEKREIHIFNTLCQDQSLIFLYLYYI